MKVAIRIKYIQEIAKSLTDYEWADIDLILGQFHLPTSISWSGSKNEYVIHHIQKALSGSLKELRDFLIENTVDDSIKNTNSFEEKIWLPKKFKIFFGHLSEDKKLVTEVKQKLISYGIDCFVAHEDIHPTLEWQNIIELGLQSCDAMAVFLTKNFHASAWTDQEVGFCLARRVLIIPLKIETNPYGFIGKYQAQNSSKLSTSEIAEVIFNILIENPLTSAKLTEAVVMHFLESDTWESARARSLLLPKIKTWTPELLRSIENSLLTHSRIPTAFGVPDRIRKILNEHSQK